jgi:hypothetical protein
LRLWSVLVVSGLRQRVALVKETDDRGGGVMSALFEDVDQVPPGQDHDRMAVFADLLVGLRVDVGRRDQDAELAVSQAGDEAAGPADADAVRGLVALGFERELDRDRVVSGTQEHLGRRHARAG